MGEGYHGTYWLAHSRCSIYLLNINCTFITLEDYITLKARVIECFIVYENICFITSWKKQSKAVYSYNPIFVRWGHVCVCRYALNGQKAGGALMWKVCKEKPHGHLGNVIAQSLLIFLAAKESQQSEDVTQERVLHPPVLLLFFPWNTCHCLIYHVIYVFVVPVTYCLCPCENISSPGQDLCFCSLM